MTDVTIVSCLYGTTHQKFARGWAESIRAMNPKPANVILATTDGVAEPTDNPVFDATIYAVYPKWRHLQAQLLNYAIAHATTEWVWIFDIDDTALPDALQGIEDVAADVWQMGYQRSDGEIYVVPQMTGFQYLNQPGNPFVGTSAIRTDVFQHVGGFQDVAFQDYDLWRRLALAGCTFQSSCRTHFRYNLHPENRTETEQLQGRRQDHMEEMVAAG